MLAPRSTSSLVSWTSSVSFFSVFVEQAVPTAVLFAHPLHIVLQSPSAELQ